MLKVLVIWKCVKFLVIINLGFVFSLMVPEETLLLSERIEEMPNNLL